MSSPFTCSTPFAGKPMAQRALFAASILTLGALGMPAAADMLDGTEFVEAMKDNTIVGKSASGVPYHLYFVEGGLLTYVDAGGHQDHGTWQVDESGNVCLHWNSSNAPLSGCYRVAVNGDQMTWGKADTKVEFELQGSVTDPSLPGASRRGSRR
jgi:hypothetical protein